MQRIVQGPPWRVIAWMCVAHVASLAGFSTYPALLPTLREEWAMSGAESGLLSGLFFAGYMVAVPVLTSLTDRIDARRVYLASSIVAAAGSAGFGFLAQGPASGAAFQLLVGAGVAGTYMPGLRALTDNTSGTAQGRAISFYTAIFGVGMAASVLLAGTVAHLAGWRTAFLVAAIFPPVAGAMVIVGLPPRRPHATAHAKRRLLDFRPVLRQRLAMAFILGYAVHCWELFGTRSWMVAFLSKAQTEQGAAWPLGAIGIAAIANALAPLASILGNEIAMRSGRPRVIRTCMTASGAVSCAFGFLIGAPWYVLLAIGLLHMALVMSDSSTLTAGLVEAADPAAKGAALALHSALGFGAGFVSPLVFGAALDAAGAAGTTVAWGAAYVTLGGAAILAPLVLRWAPRR